MISPAWESGTLPEGPRILGINPWIYDFAAFNLWSRPAGLLACLDMLRACGATVALVDCLEPAVPLPWPASRADGTGHYPKAILPKPHLLHAVPRNWGRYGVPFAWLEHRLRQFRPPPDAVLLTCAMTYWYPGVTAVIPLLRRLWPRTTIILGGVYATLCPDHARTQDVDLIVSGPLERPENWKSFWRALGSRPPLLPDNAGLDLALDLYADPPFSVLLGSRGCPFACAYCASKQLYPGHGHQKTSKLTSILTQELSRGVQNFAFYDDALLVDADKWLSPWLETLPANNRVCLHTPNAVHVRYLTPLLCRLMRRAGFQTLRLGLETASFDARLDAKITRAQWETGVTALFEAGFDTDQVGAYVLFGLPDQDPEEIRETILFARSFGIRPHLAYYSPIPGSALFAQACKASPYPLAEEPLFHNPSLWPCVPGGFSWQERGRWRRFIQ